ncbi:MAG: hypothetical protein Q4A74_09205 [Cardiobacteriaceae bacterium]|nr:hypothetical protein [Cardiobacteriaceae bacterium]
MQNATLAIAISAVHGDAWLTLKQENIATPTYCRSEGQLVLRYPLDGSAEVHGGLLQALTLCVAEYVGDYKLRRDGTLYRDDVLVAHVNLEFLSVTDESCHALVAVPNHAGLEDVLLALLAEWKLRPYIPLINRWRDYALDGDIDQKGRAIRFENGKPIFEA